MNQYYQNFNYILTRYASNEDNFLGRKFKYEKSTYRSEFQRDRDRVIHSNSFRRLKHKTQVFIYHEGDHFRTRLTHSLEVSQIARSIARYLKLNEDLCEVLSLSHDLGHTPFGHAGENALSKCMHDFGGFDHNIQTLRLLILLENVYSSHVGLNLSLNTIDGLLKHNGPVENINSYKLQIPQIFNYNLDFNKFGSLEAQISSLSDDIAYNAHDVDDGLRAKLFNLEELLKINSINQLLKNQKNITNNKLVRVLINYLVTDLIEQTKKNILENKISTIQDVYNAKFPIVSFSNSAFLLIKDLKNFLKERMYNHSFVKKWNDKSDKVISVLFNYLKKNPDKILKVNKNNDDNMERNISDYISGMTDNYALNFYENIIR